METRLAYLGIGLRPETWRYCRHISDEDAVALYSRTTKSVGALLSVNRDVAENIRRALAGIDFAEEVARLERLKIDFITKADDAYPDGLRQIYDPPAALFVRGDLGGPAGETWPKAPDARQTTVEARARTRGYATEPRRRITQQTGLSAVFGVAVVGARRCTGYGRAVAEEMAAGLAEAGITVVSGMARGIDSAAHRGALRTGKTVAVLGCGLDIVYPPENKELSAEISKNGALLSEFPPGTPPRPLNFPARNRLISGLSAAVVVVEASKRSGALITADFALEQGKEVLVVPGSVRSPVSGGCHKLLKQGAGVAEDARDVLEAIGYTPGPGALKQAAAESGASAILSLVEFDKTHVDEIMSRTNLPAQEVLVGLSRLEIEGLVCRQAGGWYIRLK